MEEKLTNHAMVDLETLDTATSAVILSIGVAVFTREEVKDTFEVHVQLDPQFEAGRTLSASTLMWWLTREEDARSAMTSGMRNALHPQKAIDEVYKFLAPHLSIDGLVFGNGAVFDNAKMDSLATDFSVILNKPWPYWADQCYRTLVHPYYDEVRPSRDGSVYHAAVDDARIQAEHLIEVQRQFPNAILIPQ